MKKSYKILITVLLPLIILYVSTMLLTRDSTFDKEVTERLDIEHIDEIEIIRASDEKTIHVTDEATIEQMMEQLKNQSLRKVRFADTNFEEAYWLTLHINDNREIGLRFDDSKHLFVYLYGETYMKDYKILNDFDLAFIQKLF